MRVLSMPHRRSSSAGAIVHRRTGQSLPTSMYRRSHRRPVVSGVVLPLLAGILLWGVNSTNANSLVNFQLNHVVSGSLQSVSSIQPSGNNQQNRDDILSGNSLHSGMDSNIKSGM